MKKSNNIMAWTQVGSSIHTLDTGPVYEFFNILSSTANATLFFDLIF